MEDNRVDDVDRRILNRLQRNGRQTAVSIANDLPITDSTVRNRIEDLERRGVIRGYHAVVDYTKVGYQLPASITCTTSLRESEEFADRIAALDAVVRVEERLTGTENLLITAVPETHEGYRHLWGDLDDLGLDVREMRLVSTTRQGPRVLGDNP